MISTHLRISNPWSNGNFDNLWNRSWLLTKHKALELEVIKYSRNVFEVQFALSVRTDHAGLTLVIGLFGRSFHFNFYDTRHWDFEKGTWEIYNE